MPTNDYDVIVFKLLVYFYACLKRTTVFKQGEFDLITKKADVNEGYLLDVLGMMQDEGLIKGLTFARTWGHVGQALILASNLADVKITSTGIHYLKESAIMQKVLRFLLDKSDTIISLIKLMGLAT